MMDKPTLHTRKRSRSLARPPLPPSLSRSSASDCSVNLSTLLVSHVRLVSMLRTLSALPSYCRHRSHLPFLSSISPSFLRQSHHKAPKNTRFPRFLTVSGMAPPQRQTPASGEESVWDYPRPPRLEPVPERIRIVFNSVTIADTTKAYRVLETSHPPVYYLPPSDINMSFLRKASGSSFCEWKGNATYWTVSVNSKTAEKVGWSYENPTSGFAAIKGYIAFYAGPMDACFVGDEKAEPQPGGFYGGWVTSRVVGPFKGGPGSWGW